MTDAQITIIRHKLGTLGKRLVAQPGEAPVLAGELARIVDALPHQAGGELVGALRARGYIEAMGNVPVWAVAEARRQIFAGMTPYGKPFAPTPVELGNLVRTIMSTYRQDVVDLGTLLQIAGEVEPDPEVKQMVAYGFDSLTAELGGKGGARRHEPTDDEIRAMAARHLAPRP